MGVDIWTDRGKDAVYEPNEPVEIKVRASDDAYLLVYDIDSEGYVRVLYPYAGGTGYIEARHTYRVPPYQSGLQLIVQGPVGEGYIVAVTSRQPFNALPGYLRPYDPQAEATGYVGEEDEDDAVTSDGRIMGDPFVAMERIRRQVLYDANDESGFATAYTSYYIHQPVRYPRYLCNDCHRPNDWAWWDGYDPYYTSCSAFDFRVYWGWSWGPRYWFGTVPYFCYVPRCYPCSPYDRPYYSSWNGYRQWNTLWSGHLTRYKSPPPVGYTPPSRYDWSRWKDSKPMPPGFLPAEYVKGANGVHIRVPIGANRPDVPRGEQRPQPGQNSRPGSGVRPGAGWSPAGRPSGEGGGTPAPDAGRGSRPSPGHPGWGQPPNPPGNQRPTPQSEKPREAPRPAAPAPPPDDKPHQDQRPAPSQYDRPHGDYRYAPGASYYHRPDGESRYAPPQWGRSRAYSRPSLAAVGRSRGESRSAPPSSERSRGESRSAKPAYSSPHPASSSPGPAPSHGGGDRGGGGSRRWR
jgi:hypothetical protein